MLKRFMEMDRRYIFLLVGICVLIPLLLPLGLPTFTTKHVLNLYNAIDAIPPEGPALLLCIDFDASTAAELMPMAKAILRQCFAKKTRVLVLSLYPACLGMAEMAVREVSQEFDVESGKDYVLLSYKPGVTAIMLSIGEDICKTLETDYYGNDLKDLPMMEDIHNYDDIPLLVSLAGSDLPTYWVIYVGTTYHQRVGCGTTAVSAAQYYPWLQTGQFVGMLGGLKGAAEYENLVERAGYTKARKVASIGMEAQSIAHLLLILLIILGNIAYFTSKRKE